jgi:2,4-dienoyl-CoA reductase-like NADH-dependent reductase (Old Yellow Enzyme family)
LKVVDSVIKAKKEMSKDDFIIGYRFSPEERENPGITLDDTKILVDKLSNKELDYLHISLGEYEQTSIRKESDEITGKEILKVIKGRVPLIGVGSVFSEDDLEKAEEIGYDLIAIGRGLLIEPKIITALKNNKKIEKIIDKDNTTLPENLLKKIIKHQKPYDITIK